MFVVARLPPERPLHEPLIKWYRHAVFSLTESDKSFPLQGNGPPKRSWENHSTMIVRWRGWIAPAQSRAQYWRILEIL
jgi:hypothetical protein